MGTSFRKFQRYQVFARAVVRSKNVKRPMILNSQVNNISQGGIGVYTESPLMKSTPVSVELSFTSFDDLENKNYLEGSVASLIKEDDCYFLGIAFDKAISHENFMKMIQLEY